ncbi:WhiB family transcriptional regulator [Dactylosporangium sp. CA-052675]|uniref:WhiB family transcriptional regulator n=1 Tax=Dactylosporangium sp. CA-052675 TaxID=3239927 RepID=UPI003D8B0C96
MTRARMPRPHEVAAAKRDPRLLRAVKEQQGDGAWRIRGACQAVDPETFFPAPTEPADAAVALCRTCDVQGACLAWALDVGDCHGVWGATTPRERRAMLVAWRSEGQGPGVPGQSDPRLGAMACLPILPLQRTRSREQPDPVGAGAPQ